MTIIAAIMLSVFVAVCNNRVSAKTEKIQQTVKSADTTVEIVGKSGTVTFPQFQVVETFISDSVLHWKLKNEKGEIMEEDEKISYKKLNDHQFFLNWIEKSGLTVSQVLDVQNGTATAFVSRPDDKSDRGHRSSMFLKGSFKLNN